MLGYVSSHKLFMNHEIGVDWLLALLSHYSIACQTE